MMKEEKDKILKKLVNERNNFAKDCERRAAEENGKVIGADYMLQRFLECFNSETEEEE